MLASTLPLWSGVQQSAAQAAASSSRSLAFPFAFPLARFLKDAPVDAISSALGEGVLDSLSFIYHYSGLFIYLF